MSMNSSKGIDEMFADEVLLDIKWLRYQPPCSDYAKTEIGFKEINLKNCMMDQDFLKDQKTVLPLKGSRDLFD